MKRLSLFVVLFLFMTACSAQAPSAQLVQTAIAQTQIAGPTNTSIPTNPPTATTGPTRTPAPTNTPRPTSTRGPTITPLPTKGDDRTRIVAKNYVASQDNDGVVVEVARLLVADKTAIKDWEDTDFSRDKSTTIELIFRITNNTDKVVSLYADHAMVSVNGEPVEVWDYVMDDADFGDELGGEFLPGVTAIGGVWIMAKRTAWNDVNNIIIKIDNAHDADYNDIGNDYIFNIDVKDWGFEEYPKELQ